MFKSRTSSNRSPGLAVAATKRKHHHTRTPLGLVIWSPLCSTRSLGAAGSSSDESWDLRRKVLKNYQCDDPQVTLGLKGRELARETAMRDTGEADRRPPHTPTPAAPPARSCCTWTGSL